MAIYLYVNEIPVQKRYDSIIVTGLWFGQNKPEMGVFLDVFVNAMNKLTRDGIKCNIKSETLLIKVYTILACVDSITRAPMNGSCQFNAYY